jgi:hypothetical protein
MFFNVWSRRMSWYLQESNPFLAHPAIKSKKSLRAVLNPQSPKWNWKAPISIMVAGKYPGKNHSWNHPDLSICEFNKKRTDPRNTPLSFEVRSQYYVIFSYIQRNKSKSKGFALQYHTSNRNSYEIDVRRKRHGLIETWSGYQISWNEWYQFLLFYTESASVSLSSFPSVNQAVTSLWHSLSKAPIDLLSEQPWSVIPEIPPVLRTPFPTRSAFIFVLNSARKKKLDRSLVARFSLLSIDSWDSTEFQHECGRLLTWSRTSMSALHGRIKAILKTRSIGVGSTQDVEEDSSRATHCHLASSSGFFPLTSGICRCWLGWHNLVNTLMMTILLLLHPACRPLY